MNPIIPVQVGECVIQRFTKCRGVNLDSVLLIRADFRGADLSGANLTNAILYRADLRNASLRDANIIGTRFINADLRGVDFHGAIIGNGTCRHYECLSEKWKIVYRLQNSTAEFIYENLGISLSGQDFGHANLRGANLRYADLRGANLRGSDLRGADLGGAVLKGMKIDDDTQLDEKWRNVWTLVNRHTYDFHGLNDLSEANLRGTEIHGID